MRYSRLGGWVILAAVTGGFTWGAKEHAVAVGTPLVNADPGDRSIATLREQGASGLQTLLDAYDTSRDASLIPTIEAVAQQRGAVGSRLFWYTNLPAAQKAARSQHKPILYLRMLGKLTDEYSCANSRFFRTALYANENVAKLLRERFILVWESERPVPVITVDYGDGRILKRTLTGNSVHYVLDADGCVMDALPGVYGPQAFVSALNGSARLAASSYRSATANSMYLNRVDNALLKAWRDDMQRANPELLTAQAGPIVQAAQQQEAIVAMRKTQSKSKVEQPLLAAISPQFASAMNQSIDTTDAATWDKLAALHAADAVLDAASIELIRSQNPLAYADSAALARTVAQFQQSIALDTVHNNYQLRRQVIGWLKAAPGTLKVEELNRRVYAELFRTPKSDPWLGLVPDATYTALTNDGCIVAARGSEGK